MRQCQYAKRVFLLLFSAFCVSACFLYDFDKDIEIIKKENVVCMPNADLKVSRWGGMGVYGLLKTCEVKHGPFIAVNEGYIQIRGQYNNGVADGIWNFCDKDGNVVTTIDYGSEKEHAP